MSELEKPAMPPEENPSAPADNLHARANGELEEMPKVKDDIAIDPPQGIDENNIRQVTLPIPAESLREYFGNKDLFFIVNYSQSKLKGDAFLTYLTNLNIPCDVKFDTPLSYETYSEALLAYMNQNSIVNTAGLHVMAAEMLLVAKGLPYERSPYALPIGEEIVRRFIDENKELIDKWLHFLDSTQVFALSAISALNRHYQPKDRFPNVDDKNYIGRNVAMMYCMPDFIGIYFAIEGAKYKMSYFTQQFEQFMFKNDRLAKYFRNRNNLAAVMFENVALGNIKAEEIDLGILSIGVYDKNGPFYVAAPYVCEQPNAGQV